MYRRGLRGSNRMRGAGSDGMLGSHQTVSRRHQSGAVIEFSRLVPMTAPDWCTRAYDSERTGVRHLTVGTGPSGHRTVTGPSPEG